MKDQHLLESSLWLPPGWSLVFIQSLRGFALLENPSLRSVIIYRWSWMIHDSSHENHPTTNPSFLFVLFQQSKKNIHMTGNGVDLLKPFGNIYIYIFIFFTKTILMVMNLGDETPCQIFSTFDRLRAAEPCLCWSAPVLIDHLKPVKPWAMGRKRCVYGWLKTPLSLEKSLRMLIWLFSLFSRTPIVGIQTVNFGEIKMCYGQIPFLIKWWNPIDQSSWILWNIRLIQCISIDSLCFMMNNHLDSPIFSTGISS